MNVLIIVVMILIILTKLMDVLSTIIRIQHPQIETNPFAQKMMYKIGIKTTAWIVFGIVLVIVIVLGANAFRSDIGYQIFFLTFGVVLSVIQFAVAHHNWSRRPNFITRQVMAYHLKIKGLFPKSW